tara:strand:- start:202 stop:2538 length:2337 start_codon:yes stop_codon:yes gene_type:complete
MAYITLAGTLKDPNGAVAVGDQIRFTHNSTTGETVKSSVSILTIEPSGVYSINLEYGLVLIEYKDIRSPGFKNLGVATVNATNPATSIPELLNAVVPVSSAELIEFQTILADCVAAKVAAAASASSVDTTVTIARSLNILNSQIIYSTDTTSLLDDVLYIYNNSAQKNWAIPNLVGLGERIISVTGSTLVTTSATYILRDFSPTIKYIEDYLQVGDSDYTAAFDRAIQSGYELHLKQGVTYFVSGVKTGTQYGAGVEPIAGSILKLDIENFALVGNGASIISTAAAPSGPREASIMAMYSSAWGVSKNITITGVTFNYQTPPTVRIDNNFVFFADGINGLTLKNNKVLNSWSAAIWYKRCSNVNISYNKIRNAFADGITGMGCGRNVYVHHNDIQDVGDDAVAVTWFAAQVAVDVGETTIRTKNAHVYKNKILTTHARGVYIGGCEGYWVKDNIIDSTDAYAISNNRDTTTVGGVFENPAGVGTNSFNGFMLNNVITNAAIDSDSVFAEVGGIRNFEENDCHISGNDLSTVNNVGVFNSGAATIKNNVIDNVVLQAGGTVPLSQMSYKGSGVVSVSFSIPASCHATISNNEISNTQARAIWADYTTNRRSAVIEGNKLYNIGNISGTSDTLTISGAIYSVPNYASITNNTLAEDRAGQSTLTFIYQNSGGQVFQNNNSIINNVSGYGAVHSIISGSERWSTTTTFDPASIPAGGSIDTNITVVGAQVGMAATAIPPYDTNGVFVYAVVNAYQNLKVTLYNPTLGAVDLPSGVWRFRVK